MKKNWVNIELGKTAYYINGRAFKPSEWKNKGLPIIRIQNLNNSEAFFNYSDEEFENKYIVQNSDLLFAWSASLGAYIWRGNKAWLNQHIFKVECKPFVNKYYLYYILNKLIRDLYKKAHGSGMVHVTKKKFEKTLIPLAPLPEQRTIVAKLEQLFSKLDNSVENLKSAKNKLKIYRQAVLKKAFEGKLTNTNNLEWVKLDEVIETVEYGSSKKSDKKGLVPVLRMGNIQKGKINWSDLKYTSNIDEIEKYRLEKDDVLFNRTNSPELVGKSAIYKGEREAIFAGYLIRIRYDRNIINGDYLNYFLNSYVAKQYGNQVKTFGVNQSNINGAKLKKYPFPKVSLAEQFQIVLEIDYRMLIFDKLEESIDESLEKAEALRQSILKKAFEGELLSDEEIEDCKKEPDWEPAEKLLERIKKEE